MKHIDFYLDAIQKKNTGDGGGTGGITPTGTKEISIVANGERNEDVTQYANAHIVVDVPVPDEPTGVTQITQNGIHDVKNFASANVQVPVPEAPTGTKTVDIVQNGSVTENVREFENVTVNVNVPTGGGGTGVPQEKYDALLMTFKQNNNQYDFANDDITSLRDFAFYGDRYIRNAILQNVTQIGENAFANCKALSTISADKLYNAGAKAFNASGLTQAIFPRLEVFRSQAFAWCASLVKVKCDKAKTILDDAFNGCSKLKTIDMLGGGSISSPSLNPLTYFENLVIRSTEKITSTASLGWIPSTASIYVPDALVEQYKTATNWSQKASQIKPLSEYVEV